jgi:F-type H+-transporting ATPase subunit b
VLIDPFTIIAQIVNFVILAVALKYFLYDRVIEAMDDREAAIAQRLTDAANREAEALAELTEHQQRNEQFDRDRRVLLEQVHAEASENRQHLLEGSRADAAEERRRWRRLLDAERREFEHELRRRTADEVSALSRRALLDLAGTDIEEAVIRLGLDHLGTAGSIEVRSELFGDQAKGSPITIRTAFALTPEQRVEVADKIRSIGAGQDRPIEFETDPHLIMGIEFRSDGTSVNWNASDYLDVLDAQVAEHAATLDGPSDAD